MTLAALTRRVTYWQKTLKPLGLEHWDIEVEFADPDDTTRAHVSCSRHYDSAWMAFQKSYLQEDTPEMIDLTIIHELCHIAMRDLDHAIRSAEEFMGAVGKEIWMDEVEHVREGFVERVSRALYDAHKPDVVRSQQ